MDERQLRKRETINSFFMHISNKIADLEKKYVKKHKISDLSSAELHLLDVVSALNFPTMGEVAHQAQLTNGTITTAVKRLEKKAYIVRVMDGVDRRLIRVQLTHKGKKAVAVHVEFYEKLEMALSDSTIDDTRLLDAIKRITACFDQVEERLL